MAIPADNRDPTDDSDSDGPSSASQADKYPLKLQEPASHATVQPSHRQYLRPL